MGPVPCGQGGGQGSGRASSRSSSQGTSAPSNRKQLHRVASEGRLPQKHANSRVVASHTHLSRQELLEKHPQSLLARARAPAPLPRFVSGPNAPTPEEQRLQYAPPTRDLWEYEKVAPRDMVQVVRLEAKPYTRKGRRELMQDVASQRFRSNVKCASGLYEPLVRDAQQRPPPRVQSLPALNAARSPELSRQRLEAAQSLFNGCSPQRFTAMG